jgi:hypothetical protein
MGKETGRVSFGIGKALVWPKVCVQCLGEANKEDMLNNVIRGIPYCDDCQRKVQRLTNLEGSNFMISLIIGVIVALISFVRVGVEEGWMELLRVQTWLTVGAAGAIFGAIFYFIFWLLLQPVRAIFHSKLSKPGVKVLKSKDPNVIVLKFSNREYAKLFRETNQLTPS